MTNSNTQSEGLPPRVVITGIGVITPLGRSLGAIWSALENNESGVRNISRFDASGFESKVAGEIQESDRVDNRFRPDYFQSLRSSSRYTASAALSAIQAAGLSLTPENSGQIACVIASTESPDVITPTDEEQIENTDTSHPSQNVAAFLGITGPVIPLDGRYLSGLEAIIEASEMIRRKDAYVAIAGGTDAQIDAATFTASEDRKELTTQGNSNPALASRPLDKDRNGKVLSEGSVVFVLEALEVAVTRGAKILAEIEGKSLTFSAGSNGKPTIDPVYIGRSIQGALLSSGRIQSEIDVLMLDACGSQEGDLAEARAVHRVFGGSVRHHMYTPAVKSHIGDMGAAAAPFALALTIEAMSRQQIPSTRNIENEASDIDLDANTKGFRSDALRVAMINSVSKSNNSTMTICDPTAMREIPSDFNIPENLPIPELDI